MARGPQLYSPTSQLVSDERSRNNAGRTNQEENALQTASNQGDQWVAPPQPAALLSDTVLGPWIPGPPSPGARLPSSPDHVGVLEGLQVPQHRHLADGGERHALLARLHPHAFERHETTSVLQVPGLEHLTIGSLPDLRHAFVLLVGAAQAVLLHTARTPPGAAPLGRAGGVLCSLAAATRRLRDSPAAPSLPGARSRSPSPPPTTALRRSGSRGRRGWMERPLRGRAQLVLPRNSACRIAEEPADPSSSLPEAQTSAQTPRRLHSLCPSESQSTIIPPKRGEGRTRRKCNQTSQAPSSGFLQTPLLLFHEAPVATLRALLPSPRPLNPSWFLREKLSYFSFPAGLGAVFARRGCRGPSGKNARRGTQWNGRGRAEQPRVCRERGGGEAPGTSMSRLNIYSYIIV
ncbi:PREDICTED: uncharacterized protein LOC109373594 [Hipposideros armiger]|uniref:Uncharacterized protein LOC109373594 n=1 Tax=Hipposideros armiger TaxID=186990 RepID=A0A8B7Q2V1_HIPAR|nr:PREDICTED: uncharacterized protein LOC109373594 [Hipposideros armiger]